MKADDTREKRRTAALALALVVVVADAPAVVLVHKLEQRHGAAQVVLVVEQGLLHTLAHGLVVGLTCVSGWVCGWVGEWVCTGWIGTMW